ncbi:MAG: hypothetical protein HON47_05210 [Candidatus Diapherotrites archaeon]|uniref:Uncharacterized protein n=1 Tax=Candidatus Iainarchaeum sp. TaxID=3101447 RepID=A0A8T5GGW5_9ARCH|nr:hypothetical protein [Candidatus Diapherotrites archaeon]
MIDLALKGVGVVVMVLVLIFILMWGGILDCGEIPMGCELYEAVLGSPRVLIVHGDEGLGDPDTLKTILQDPQGVGVNAVDISHISRISLGNLKRYRLVIVEKARTISAEQLQMFMDYSTQSDGRLVWIGDAGTKRGSKEIQKPGDINALKDADNPWYRVIDKGDEFKLVAFDQFLGLKFIDNYCEEVDCADKSFHVGVLNSENTGEHPLIYGATQVLNFKISKEHDFSIVQQFPNASNSNIVLSLDLGGKLQGRENEIERYVPIIATSGLGERVAYYAYPPEYFVKDNNFGVYIKNMYYGMLGK